MIIAATKPTIPASPKPCTSETMLSATPPTNGTFPPRRETTIPKPSKAITTCVKLLIVLVRPDIILDLDKKHIYCKKTYVLLGLFQIKVHFG